MSIYRPLKIEKEETTEITHIETEENLDQNDEDKPLVEYHETLHTNKKTSR